MSGFTKVDNSIIEEMARRKFNGTQYRILFAVWRNTYGWQRSEHDLSLGFIAEATGIERSRVKKDLNKLIECKVINVVKEASFNQTRVISFNENFNEWQIDSCIPTRPQGANPTTGDQSDYTTGGGMDHTGGGESDPQQRKIKEIYKEKDDRDLVPEALYEKLFGHLPPSILQQDFIYWINESQFQEPEAILCETIRRIAKERPRKPDKYLQKSIDILLNLKLFTLEAVKEYNAKHDQKFKKKKSPQDISTERPSHWDEPKPLTKDELSKMHLDLEELPY